MHCDPSMRFYEHIAIGFVANAIAFWILLQAGLFSTSFFQNTLLTATGFFAVALFSILPDVDSINSVASKLLRLFLLVIAFTSLVEFFSTQNFFPLGKAFLALLVFVGHFLYAKRGKMHRQFPHTLSFGILACIIALSLTGSKTIALACAIAFASHVVADKHLRK